MREQVITPRTGRGAKRGGAGEMAQRPAARRSSSSSARAKSKGLGKVLLYLPLAAKATVAVVAGVLLFAGYRAAASASFFQARNVDVSGISRASIDEIRGIVKKGVMQTGVWKADLDAISRELKNVAWVRDAVVSRVLPDGLRVRVTEREPRAVVRTAAGKFLWVDDDAVTLGMASPNDQIFMRGWDEDGTEGARAQNRERVQKFLEMTKEWETKGLSHRVSEVNLNDLRDVRVQLTGDDAQIEIQLGGEDFGNRLKFALDELDRQRSSPIGPYILHINVAQGIEKGNHVTIGVSPDAPKLGLTGNDAAGPEVESKVTPRESAKSTAESRKAKEKVTPRNEEPTRKKEPAKKEKEKEKDKDKKEKAPPATKSESRPRRVG
ncbi:MAG TPA: FtsQ-type POTRA domain-containing protein [Pyrinomonadaceae bacterium]